MRQLNSSALLVRSLVSKDAVASNQPGGSIKSISAVAHAAAGNDDHIALAPESRRQPVFPHEEQNGRIKAIPSNSIIDRMRKSSIRRQAEGYRKTEVSLNQ